MEEPEPVGQRVLSWCKKGSKGDTSAFPTLAFQRSPLDAAMNIGKELNARFVVHKWKVFLWQLRVKKVYEMSQGDPEAPERVREKRWRRHPRWLANMPAKEASAAWGHNGGLTQTLRGPRGVEALQ